MSCSCPDPPVLPEAAACFERPKASAKRSSLLIPEATDGGACASDGGDGEYDERLVEGGDPEVSGDKDGEERGLAEPDDSTDPCTEGAESKKAVSASADIGRKDECRVPPWGLLLGVEGNLGEV